MHALIFTPDTTPIESPYLKIAGIDTTGKFDSRGFTIQFSGIEDLQLQYSGWIHIVLTEDEKNTILTMNLPSLGLYLKKIASQRAKIKEDIPSEYEEELV